MNFAVSVGFGEAYDARLFASLQPIYYTFCARGILHQGDFHAPKEEKAKEGEVDLFSITNRVSDEIRVSYGLTH